MRITPWLHVRTLRAADADEALFRRLCALRRQLVHVQPDVDLAADYAAFRSFFDGDSARVTLIETGTGELQGYLGWHVRVQQGPQGRVGVIDSDYYFVKPEVRGHLVLAQVAMSTYLQAARLARSTRVVIVGHGYPASVLSGLRFSGRVRFPQDTDVDAFERGAMHRFARQFCGDAFDAERQLVKMRTTPAEGRREPRTPAARAVFSRFERYNAEWLRGFGLPYIIHLTPGSIARGAMGLAAA